MLMKIMAALKFFTWIIFCVIGETSAEIKSSLFMVASKNCQSGNPVCLKVHSTLECATVCTHNDACKSYHFDEQTQVCCTDEIVIDSPQNKVYRRNAYACPSKYIAHEIDGKNYCLRFVDSDVRRTEAVSGCQADGGHLVTIDNAQMHLYIKRHLECINSGSRWIDGEDFHGTDTMLTWDRKPVPYLDWAPTEPSNGTQDCLKLSRSYDFYFRDSVCFFTDEYICQID